MTATMRAVYFLEPGKLELREVPIPEPGEGEVIIKVESAWPDGMAIAVQAIRKVVISFKLRPVSIFTCPNST